jgi:LPS export ABC transporter protein LptC
MYKRLLLILCSFCAFWACDSGLQKQEFIAYDGPLVEADHITTLYSDSAIVRVKLKAQKQFELQSGDREFPEGIYLEFYELDGSISSTLTANEGFYFTETNIYRAVGDVVVIGLQNDEKLNTEELFWSPDREEVYTDKFVRIESEGELHMGEGMVAAQDFSTWRILKPTGSIILDNESTN